MISVLARVTAAILSLSLSTALLPLIFPLLMWKLVVWVVVWVKYGRTRSLAEPLDCWYLSQPKQREINIVVAFKLEGRWDESVYDLMQKVVDEMNRRSTRRFKLNAVPTQFLGFWCWDWRQERLDVRQCMTIPDHVNSNVIYRKKDVEKYVSEVMGTPFPEGQPPWSISVFPKFDDDNHMCLVFRYHHALADGASFSALIEKHLTVKGNSCERIDRRTTWVPRGSWKATLLYVEAACLAIPVTSYVCIRILIRRMRLVSPGDSRVCSSEWFSVARLKQVAAEKKKRVGDLLLAAAIHAPSSHCIFKKGQPSPSTTVYTVFSLNKADTGALKNHALAYPVNFNTDKLLTSEARLDNVSKVMDAQRRSFKIPLSFGVGCLFNLFVYPSVCMQNRFFCVSDASMAMSNLRGPRGPINFGHLKAVDVFTFVNGQDKTGIFALSMSYNGYVKCGFLIDEALVKKNHSVEDVAEDFNIYMNQMLR